MNKTHASPTSRQVIVWTLLVACFLTMLAIGWAPSKAYAKHEVNELNKNQAYGQSMVAMGVESDDCYVEDKHSSVVQYDFIYKNEDGEKKKYREFYIKHNKNKETTAGGKGTVLLKIRRDNARKIDGRYADCRISITYVHFSAGTKAKLKKGNYKGKDYGSFEDATYVQIAHQSAESFFVGTRSKNKKGVVDAAAKYNINVKVEWVWHGTSTVVPGSFIQVVKDLDQKDDGEAWMARSGSDWSKFWWFKNTTLKKSQDDSDGVSSVRIRVGLWMTMSLFTRAASTPLRPLAADGERSTGRTAILRLPSFHTAIHRP